MCYTLKEKLIHIRNLFYGEGSKKQSNGVFTLPDTETDDKWLVHNYVKVFMLHKDRRQHRSALVSVLFICFCVKLH